MKQRVNHYARRARERASVANLNNASSFAANANRYGHPPKYYVDKFKDDPVAQRFFEFLTKKSLSGKRVKVYRQWIFIFNTSNSNAVTVYPVPEEYESLITTAYNTKVIFKFFHPINIEESLTVRREEVTFPHIRSIFAHVLHANQSLSDLGPFCIKQNGQIEHDFICVGMWRVVSQRDG